MKCMNVCNANPRNKENNKKTKVTKSIAMKHKDHVRKTPLD